MEKIDSNKFDTLNLFVKKIKRQDVVDTYTSLGWKLLTEKENDRYEDIIDLTFLRPHKIQNKDQLQLMQVYTEDNLNEIAKLEKFLGGIKDMSELPGALFVIDPKKEKI